MNLSISFLVCFFICGCSAGFPQLFQGASFVRGDRTCDENVLAGSDSKRILQLLESSPSLGKFHVQGWRWHTMSLIREASRLQRLASKLNCDSTSEKDTPVLKDAIDYVVGFNMKGLHSIERDLFFPWVRKKLQADKNLGKYFEPVLNQLEMDRRKVENLGAQLVERAEIVANPSISDDVRCKAIIEISDKASAVVDSLESMLHREETLLVPAVARIVPESEQKSFNNKVIRKLGILDSRLHLVGMHEAVWDLKDTSERELFDETIPSIPRMMIPRWKRLLYEPRAGMLN